MRGTEVRITATRPSLRSGFNWTFGGNVVAGFLQWLTLLGLARLVDADGVGTFALGLAIVSPIALLANLKLREVVATDTNWEYQPRTYVQLRILGVATLLIAVLVVLAAMRPSRETGAVIAAIAAGRCFDSVSDLLHGFQQRVEKMDRVAISMILRSALQLVGSVAAIYATGSLVAGAVAWSIGSLATILVYDMPQQRTLDAWQIDRTDRSASIPGASLWSPFDATALRSLFALVAPLGLAGLVAALSAYVPRYFIEVTLDTSSLGIFVVLVSTVLVGVAVVSSLINPAVPRLALYHSSCRFREFDSLVMKLALGGLAIGLIGTVLAAAAGEELTRLLFGAEYAAESRILVLLAAGATIQFVHVFFGAGIQAMRVFWVHLPIQITTLVVVTMLCIALIPTHGLVGAAVAALIAQTVEFGLLGAAFFTVRWLARRGLAAT